MTAYVERASYRAVLRDDASEEALEAAVAAAASDARARVHEGELLTAGLYRYHNQLFLYLEHIYEGQGGGEDGVASRPNLVPKRCALPDFAAIRRAPAVWRWLDGLLVPFPGLRGLEPWAYMCPVFWFDEPTTPESYLRRPAPDERCGRIAVLQPDKLMDALACGGSGLALRPLPGGERGRLPRDRAAVLLRALGASPTPRSTCVCSRRRLRPSVSRGRGSG